MNKHIQRFSLALSILLGASVFIFFGYFYPFHLAYQEQFQLFLFTPGYLLRAMGKPGGAAEYLAGFLTQFYGFAWAGAAILSLLLVGIQRLLLQLIVAFAGSKPALFPLSFIPSLFYWVLLCDEHYMLAGVVALFLSLLCMRVYGGIRRRPLRVGCLYGMYVLLYWLVGGAGVVFVLLGIIWEIGKGGAYRRTPLLFLMGGCYLLILFLPFLAQLLLPQYPLAKLFAGANYYRFQAVFPSVLAYLWALTVVIPLLFRYLPSPAKARSAWIAAGFLSIAFAWITWRGVAAVANWQKEEVMAYDYQVQNRRWDAVIRMADRRTPASPLSVAFLNLALCKQGLMADRMFRYYQNGLEGLLPSFVRDFTMPLMAGEIYYHLGFINAAQRLAFEAMEAIPDYQKSARAMKRLAETNLLNGQYAVARKYLQILRHTLYYSEWSEQTMALLGDEGKIDANPEWRSLRQFRTRADFLFSEQEKDQMLGLLFRQNPANRMAYEYLMACCLLTKDLKGFYDYYPLGRSLNYPRIPLSYQEALIYIWGLSHDNLAAIPFPISDEVKRSVQEYGQIYTTRRQSEPLLRNRFAGTYWYYLHFRK